MGYFTRRSFVKVGSFSTFGFFGLGDALRMQAQSPAPARRDISIPGIASPTRIPATAASSIRSKPRPKEYAFAGNSRRSPRKPTSL